jgi:hypothetical protein
MKKEIVGKPKRTQVKRKPVAYAVQDDMDKTIIHIFTKRTVLCRVMEKSTGVKWVKGTLDYHFGKKKETEFGYRGYTIYMRREVHKDVKKQESH